MWSACVSERRYISNSTEITQQRAGPAPSRIGLKDVCKSRPNFPIRGGKAMAKGAEVVQVAQTIRLTGSLNGLRHPSPSADLSCLWYTVFLPSPSMLMWIVFTAAHLT